LKSPSPTFGHSSTLCLGLSNKAIARELGIEEVTVKLHLRKVFQKLGATNRAHAVTIAHDRGLLIID
jgi:DNA-binding NarL/FixJ family response regulator